MIRLRTGVLHIGILMGVGTLLLSSTSYGFSLASRWSSTALSGGGLGQGDPTTITWGIVADGTSISGSEGTSDSSFISLFDSLYGSGPGGTDLTQRPWFHFFDESYERWEELSGLTLTYEPNDSGHAIDGSTFPSGSAGVRADMRIGAHAINGPGGTQAYNYFPGHGDMVMDINDSGNFGNTSNDSRRLRNTIMHEAGHGLGIQHSNSNKTLLLEPNLQLSINSPQLDDILAIQRHYGDALEKNGGNNTSANATPLGSIEVFETFTIGSDARISSITIDHSDFVSIDDNSDVDFFSFTVSDAVRLDVVLTPLGESYNVGPQGGTQSPFDPTMLSDLSLTIYDTNGFSQLGSFNAGGLGEAEMAEGLLLDEAGTYFARVTGANNQVQLYELALTTEPDSFLPGDINMDTIVDELDIAAFVAGWKTVQPTDDGLTAYGKGDLDLNRISDLRDAYLLHEALANAGMGANLLSTLNIPEPTSLVLLGSVMLMLGATRRIAGEKPE